MGLVCGEFQKLKDSEAVDGYERNEEKKWNFWNLL